jgi:uncharacterized protein (TIGR03118 family)
MEKNFQKCLHFYTKCILSFFAVLMLLSACNKFDHFVHLPEHLLPFADNFHQVNLVANNSSYNAATTDVNLLNAWGVAFASSGPAWISSNGAGLSTIYNSSGVVLRPPVTIPSPITVDGGTPTGVVFNGTTGFKLSNGKPARFIFAGEDGVISAWNTGNLAEVAKLNLTAGYKGVTLAMDGGVPFLYFANFKEHKVEVYDTLWNWVSRSFMDPAIPSNYSPFNVQNINGKIFVVYAKVGSGIDEADGPGTGFVDIFNPDGSFVKRFISHGELNAPWGITDTHSTFWGTDMSLPDIILVGNFGDGRINAFDEKGVFLGPLRHHGKPIEIDGLWGLSFAPATATTVNPDWLFFAAGPKDEADGLFGYITMDSLIIKN